MANAFVQFISPIIGGWGDFSRMDTLTKLIIGLGNPGKDYEGTRHNIGFAVVDSFARRHGIAVTKRDFQALNGDGRVEGSRVYLMKPQTFMNLSGQSVAPLARRSPVAPRNDRAASSSPLTTSGAAS